MKSYLNTKIFKKVFKKIVVKTGTHISLSFNCAMIITVILAISLLLTEGTMEVSYEQLSFLPAYRRQEV